MSDISPRLWTIHSAVHDYMWRLKGRVTLPEAVNAVAETIGATDDERLVIAAEFGSLADAEPDMWHIRG